MKLLISTHFVEVDYSNYPRIKLWGFFVVYDVKCVTHFGKLISTLPFNSCLRCQEVIQLWTNFAAQVLASQKYILHFLFVLRSFGWPEVKVPSKIFMFSLYSEKNIMERYFDLPILSQQKV